MEIRAVLFDMIGTTVREKDPTTIERCVQHAFADHNIKVPPTLIRGQRGKAKREMISTLLLSMKAPLHLTPSVLERFKSHFTESLQNFETNNDFPGILAFLRSAKIHVGIGTGLTSDLADMLFTHLQWKREDFAYVGTASEAGPGRPSPVMINHMLGNLRLIPEQLLKVGDTTADIKEGKNAGALTAVLLAGTQDEVLLMRQQPDFILHSLSELEEILSK